MRYVSVHDLFNDTSALDNIAATIIMAEVYWNLADNTNEFDKALVAKHQRALLPLERRRLVLNHARYDYPRWIVNKEDFETVLKALQSRLQIYPPRVSTLEKDAIDKSFYYGM